ncbi:unnamed protein product [Amoebophrya sp. A25]|nr:unnamed protein product [Amoebophrya sp. A25]|eukprot:GSA25T00022357001.1
MFVYPKSGENLWSLVQNPDPVLPWRRTLSSSDMYLLSETKRRFFDSADPREAVKLLHLKHESESPRHGCSRVVTIEDKLELARKVKIANGNAKKKVGVTFLPAIEGGHNVQRKGQGHRGRNGQAANAPSASRTAAKNPTPSKQKMGKLLASTIEAWNKEDDATTMAPLQDGELRETPLHGKNTGLQGSREKHDQEGPPTLPRNAVPRNAVPPLPKFGSFGFPGSDALDRLPHRKFCSLKNPPTGDEQLHYDDGKRLSPRRWHEMDRCLYETDAGDVNWDLQIDHRWNRPRLTNSWLEGHALNVGYHLPHTFEHVTGEKSENIYERNTRRFHHSWIRKYPLLSAVNKPNYVPEPIIVPDKIRRLKPKRLAPIGGGPII